MHLPKVVLHLLTAAQPGMRPESESEQEKLDQSLHVKREYPPAVGQGSELVLWAKDGVTQTLKISPAKPFKVGTTPS